MTPRNADAPPLARRGVNEAQTNGRGLQGNDSAGGPLALILPRLELVRRAGKGYSARCPAHADRTASLSLSEGRDGRALLNCFAGCSALDVVHAVGLEVGDLFPSRLPPTTPEAKREARMRAREAEWSAALGTLAFEGRIVALAASERIHCRPLAWADLQRVAVAAERIEACRDRLAPPRPWRPGAKA